MDELFQGTAGRTVMLKVSAGPDGKDARMVPVVPIDNDASLRNRAEENRDFGNQLLTRVSKMLLDRLLGTRTQLVDLYGMRP